MAKISWREKLSEQMKKVIPSRTIDIPKKPSRRDENIAAKESKRKADELFKKMVLKKAKAAFKTKHGRVYNENTLYDPGKLNKLQSEMRKKWKHFGTSKWKGKDKLGL